MKTYKNLFPSITSFENLYWAFRHASRGKRRKNDVAFFEYKLEENLFLLKDELETGSYQPGHYFQFYVHDPKKRLISAAPFRDRVVHHALCLIIEPIFESRFIYDSYACRKGKGTHAALNRAQGFSRQYPYVLQCDIQHFFPTIDHQILTQQFARIISDSMTLDLINKILHSGDGLHPESRQPQYFPGDGLFDGFRPRGLPIGNLTSQFWANVYLNPFDHWIKRELKCKGYVRYVDDFLLFSDNKRELNQWRTMIINFLSGFRLKLHENRAMIFPVQTGIPFLGFRVYPDHRRLKRRNGIKFQRKFASLRREYKERRISHQKIKSVIHGWIAHVRHADTWGLRRSLISRHVI